MGVEEIAPGLFRSCILTDEDKKEIDLGCYAEQGPAAVAHDLMLIRLRWRSGERRLPRIEDGVLLNPTDSYDKIIRSFVSEMEKDNDALAVELKSKGLAERLHCLMTGVKPPASLHAPLVPPPSTAPVLLKRAVEPKAPEQPTKRLKAEEIKAPHVPPAKPAAAAPIKTEVNAKTAPKDSNDDPKKLKETKKPSQKPSKEPKAKVPSKKAPPGAEELDDENAPLDTSAIMRVWLKDDPEYPPKSGKYPCYVKAGPMKTGYFTLSVKMVPKVLPTVQHGDITMVDAENPEKSWPASYSVKEAENRQLGNFKGSRYFRSLRLVQEGLGMKPGDVVYFMKAPDEEEGKVLIGIWKEGTPEARKFTRELINCQLG